MAAQSVSRHTSGEDAVDTAAVQALQAQVAQLPQERDQLQVQRVDPDEVAQLQARNQALETELYSARLEAGLF